MQRRTDCGSILLDLPGSPRSTVWYEDGRLWVVEPDGRETVLTERPTSQADAISLVGEMYRHQPVWGYREPNLRGVPWHCEHCGENITVAGLPDSGGTCSTCRGYLCRRCSGQACTRDLEEPE